MCPFLSPLLSHAYFGAVGVCSSPMNAEAVYIPVSIKHGLWTTDFGLGYKTQTRYKMWTRNYSLSIKYGVGIKRGLWTVYVKTTLER